MVFPVSKAHTCNGTIFTNNSVPEILKTILEKMSTFPYSTAECLLGLILLINTVTDLRASFLIFSNVFSLMLLNSNGPPTENFQSEKYVKPWLFKHR
jgi:hypothetical protein